MSQKGEQHIGDAVSDTAGTAVNAGENFPIEKVIGFEAIYNSMMLCKRGVMWKNSVCAFVLNGIEQSLKLEDELRTGTYKSRPPKTFLVTRPKKREIIAIAFRDRVYQRSLNDNCIYPFMTKSFIYDNMACQKGKGTDKARNRLKCFMQRMQRKYGRNYYVLQIDIHGYYPNMRHDNTEKMFSQKLPPEVMEKVQTILHDQYPGDVGYNPGSQLIQIAGISVPNDLDHRIKEQLHIKCYVRYNDDFIILHEKREHLETCKEFIGHEIASKGFEFNPKKTRIYPVTKGITFLGYTFRPTETGKVLMLLSPDNVKDERKKLRKLVRLAKLGLRTRAKVYECYSSWRDHASKGNNFKLLCRMDQYLKELWGEQNENCKTSN